MAHHKSAKKRIRSDAAKNARSSSYISGVRSAVRSFKSSVEKGQAAEEVKGLLLKAQTLVDKAATKGILHKNTASRSVARMAKLFAKFEKGEVLAPKGKGKSKKNKRPKASKK